MYAKLLSAILIMGIGTAWAGESTTSSTCPVAAQTTMDTAFGSGTSAITTCIKVRDNIKSAINLGTVALNSKSGISQTITNVNNMIQNYEGMYGLERNDDYRITVVAHGAGGRFLLTDEAYNRTYAVTTGNPSRAAMEALIAKGIPIYMCQNTMRANSWRTSDLIPGLKQTPAGVVSLIDYGMQGWVVLTP